MEKKLKQLETEFRKLQQSTSMEIQKAVKQKSSEMQDILKENENLKQKLEEKMVTQANNIQIPLPSPIIMTGDIRTNIDFFENMWNNYLVITGKGSGEENIKIAILLSCIGEEASKILFKIENVYENNQTASNLIHKLKIHCTSSINIRFERYLFNTVKQNEDEGYNEYILKLKSMIKTCNYGTMEEELLLDKLVCSIKSIHLKQKLWMKPDLKLDDAINICKSTEEAQKQLTDIENKENIICNVRSDKNQKNERDCKYCGYKWHKSLRDCPARTAKCNNCGKIGHFKKVCLSSENKQVKEIGEYAENKQYVLKINGKKQVTSDLCVVLENGCKKLISFQLDTGATCNVIGKMNLLEIINLTDVDLNNSKIVLNVFGGIVYSLYFEK